jgi:L-threonylcarbamoyladenylate synthase
VLGERLSLRREGVRAPGGLPAHYAPATPLQLVARRDLAAHVARLVEHGTRVGVLPLGEPIPGVPVEACQLPMPGEADAYARALYATLRAADVGRHDVLLVEMPPDRPAWLAVRDRLGRAAKAVAVAHGPAPSGHE